MEKIPVIAILGRPNTGKSTLFNRLTGRRRALVDDIPGLTRDRREGEAKLGDLSFLLIDTAGLEEAEDGSLAGEMMRQTARALDQADIALFLTDGRQGITPDDKHFANWLRKSGKPVILAANKCESGKAALSGIAESYALGLGEPVAVSAEHGLGLGELYERIRDSGKFLLGEDSMSEPALSGAPSRRLVSRSGEHDEKPTIQIAILGRPNAGKSTLFNALLGEERAIVSPIAGTTRDAVYVERMFEGAPVRLVDTAGLRKRAKRQEKLERLATADSMEALRYAHVAVVLIDATQALEKQDLTIAQHVAEEGRGLVIAVNKWDLVENKKALREEIGVQLRYSLGQVPGVPVVTLSASEGKNVREVIRRALAVYKAWNVRVSTGRLNRWLEDTIARNPPPLSGGKRVKLRYITQVKTRPPAFSLFSNSNIEDLPESYLRYLINELRESFGFAGVPVRLHVRKGENPYNKR